VRFIIGRRAVVTVVLAIALVLAMSAVAFAATPADGGAGRDFGKHHPECARACGLSGEMNPGMHQGLYGWMDCAQQ
jgi:hypothetical protein